MSEGPSALPGDLVPTLACLWPFTETLEMCEDLAQGIQELRPPPPGSEGRLGGVCLTWLKLGSNSTWPLLSTCRMGALMAACRSKPSHSLFTMACRGEDDAGREAGGVPVTLPNPSRDSRAAQ